MLVELLLRFRGWTLEVIHCNTVLSLQSATAIQYSEESCELGWVRAYIH